MNHFEKRRGKMMNTKDRNEEKKENKNRRNRDLPGTTAIRISTDLYELLREKAFYNRTTIRQIADDILGEALNE